eukprot:TRINITY_DN986_c0_g3_i2.p1 TRINITY_DN986_c0_g3~~TRINITY_DN986_c0_g3_i2.p1  ORF type:complete len:341 (-),score=55.79 TRINITY_DN986_c0_g3_i2:301-1323(-)
MSGQRYGVIGVVVAVSLALALLISSRPQPAPALSQTPTEAPKEVSSLLAAGAGQATAVAVPETRPLQEAAAMEEQAAQPHEEEQPRAPATEQEDVMSRLVPPPSDPTKYPEGKHWGQVGQDKWVDKVLHELRGGFVIESGAHNGQSHSNSFFFEASRGWECLLVEPNPHLQPVILDLKRNCHLFKGGLSLKWEPSTFKFDLAGPLGGIVDTLSAHQKARMRREIKQGASWMRGEQGSGNIVDVKCFPLHTILLAMGKKVVDYWSLDTEGSEQGILEHTDFTKIVVGVMTIEHGEEHGRREGIYNAMRAAGFKRVQKGNQDDYYANPAYFKMKGLPMPREV